MKNCIHYIGLMYDYDDTKLITLLELEEEIENNAEMKRRGYNVWYRKFYTREDYCDRRVSTNLHHFNHCPKCGAKIDWKAIKNKKGGDNK